MTSDFSIPPLSRHPRTSRSPAPPTRSQPFRTMSGEHFGYTVMHVTPRDLTPRLRSSLHEDALTARRCPRPLGKVGQHLVQGTVLDYRRRSASRESTAQTAMRNCMSTEGAGRRSGCTTPPTASCRYPAAVGSVAQSRTIIPAGTVESVEGKLLAFLMVKGRSSSPRRDGAIVRRAIPETGV